MTKQLTHPNWLRAMYFWIGVIATIAYRIIVVLNNYNPIWVQIAWYIGTVGFIIYFIHRYQISELRQQLIIDHQLAAKIEREQKLSLDDRKALLYILKTLRSTREKWNYIVIFASSVIALIIGIWLDFLR